MFDWSEEATETLKRMWGDKLTSYEIAAELGCSRNAVIGKVHRLKLDRRRSSPGTNKQKELRALKRLKPAPTMQVKRGREIIRLAKPPEMTRGELRALLHQAVLNTGRAA